MIRIQTLHDTATTAKTYYVPVPCRGIVKAVRAVPNFTQTATYTITLSRVTASVSVVSVANAATGALTEGTADSTNKDLIFDPDTSTYESIKIVTSVTSVGTVGLSIDYDESAAVAQAASEA